jgi:hypothetical protein
VKVGVLLEEYAKHSVLNVGQALHGIVHIASHPDIDEIAARGSPRHLFLSVLLRTRRLANDLFFAVIPPHWHHTADELRVMRTVPMGRWFLYGFAAWRYTESGEVRADWSAADRRWDPRCRRSMREARLAAQASTPSRGSG